MERATAGEPQKTMHRWAGGLVLVLTALILTACQTTAQRNDRLVRFFDEISFGGPMDANVSQDKKIAKVTGPLRVAVSGVDAEDYTPRVLDSVQRLSELTGVNATFVDPGSSANVTIEFVEKDAFLVNQEYTGCYVQLGRMSNQISSGKIYISVQNPERIDICIAHELMHLFGFRYHSGIVRSALSPVHKENAITPWDEIVLKTLYDPRISPGMSRKEAMPIAQSIIEQ